MICYTGWATALEHMFSRISHLSFINDISLHETPVNRNYDSWDINKYYTILKKKQNTLRKQAYQIVGDKSSHSPGSASSLLQGNIRTYHNVYKFV